MKRPIVWTPKSRDDLSDIVQHLGAASGVAAEHVAGLIKRAIGALGEMPTGRPGRVVGVYEKSVTGAPYIIAYQIVPSEAGVERIAIVRIIHQARNWPTGGWPTE